MLPSTTFINQFHCAEKRTSTFSRTLKCKDSCHEHEILSDSLFPRRSITGSMIPLCFFITTCSNDDFVWNPNANLKNLADQIRTNCPLMLKYATSTGKFLYRGGNGESNEYVLTEPDLLVEGTYPKEGTMFFEKLERWLQHRGSLARPSTGHIAISDVSEAGLWGPAKSCWPLGDFDYVWLKHSRLLFSDGLCDESESTCFDDLGIEINSNIDEALRRGHEVLFRAPGFLLIPSAADAQLRTFLGIKSPQ
jgi:hypothetical protein